LVVGRLIVGRLVVGRLVVGARVGGIISTRKTFFAAVLLQMSDSGMAVALAMASSGIGIVNRQVLLQVLLVLGMRKASTGSIHHQPWHDGRRWTDSREGPANRSKVICAVFCPCPSFSFR